MSDRHILRVCCGAKVVVVDGPLTPTERRPFRRRDVEFRRFAPVLPLTTPGMKTLASRCRRLVGKPKWDVEVLETFPRAVERFVEVMGEPRDDHACDACLCCAAGIAHLLGLSVLRSGSVPRAYCP